MTYLEHWTWLTNGESLVGSLANMKRGPIRESGLSDAWAWLRGLVGDRKLPETRHTWVIHLGPIREQQRRATRALRMLRQLEEATWPEAMPCSRCGDPIAWDQACYQGMGGSLHLPAYTAEELYEDLESADEHPVTPDDYEDLYGCPPRTA